jgi:hypothetical protein
MGQNIWADDMMMFQNIGGLRPVVLFESDEDAVSFDYLLLGLIVVGTFSFRLIGYCQLKDDLDIGYCIRSPPSIRLGGFSWCLSCYLNGDHRKESKCFIGIYCNLLSKNGARARVTFNIRLIDQTIMSSSTIGHKSAPLVFSSIVDTSVDNATSWGFMNSIMWRTDWENSSYLVNDSLLFECEINVIKESTWGFSQ